MAQGDSIAFKGKDKKEILRERARRYAQIRQKSDTLSEAAEYITFILGSETYGIESIHIQEVCPLKDLTYIPCAPPFVLGIINLRGQILSVIDLKRFFDIPDKGISELNQVIIVRTEAMELGILADAIAGVKKIAAQAIKPPLPTLTGIRADYLKGITDDRLVLIDAGKLLADPKLVVHETLSEIT